MMRDGAKNFVRRNLRIHINRARRWLVGDIFDTKRNEKRADLRRKKTATTELQLLIKEQEREDTNRRGNESYEVFEEKLHMYTRNHSAEVNERCRKCP